MGLVIKTVYHDYDAELDMLAIATFLIALFSTVTSLWIKISAMTSSDVVWHKFGLEQKNNDVRMLVRFLSRVNTLTRDIDVAILSVCPSVRLSVRCVPVLNGNGLT